MGESQQTTRVSRIIAQNYPNLVNSAAKKLSLVVSILLLILSTGYPQLSPVLIHINRPLGAENSRL